ncbi:GNAT family N-acetyltransferase [Desulfonatronospira sp.]|uniref:GNAT family N-acetyltransferase n=1 Tax=Desulfonatronospira sp. TaxID=1962951 RepID=UPI0025B92FC0|nr:GNAT family N-acetyltransferase [Desulfonatronospira sp.]
MAEKFEKVQNHAQINRTSRLAREIWQDHYTPIIGPEQVEYMLKNFQSPGAINDQLQSGVVYYLVVRADEDSGYLALEPDPEKASAKLSKIYVLKDKRRCGLGRKTLEFAEMLCRDMGIKDLWLTVNRHNHAAIAFYRQEGFTAAETVVQDIGGGFVMDDYKMVKNLSPG